MLEFAGVSCGGERPTSSGWGADGSVSLGCRWGGEEGGDVVTFALRACRFAHRSSAPFCAAPVYQMREYYVKGELDDCLSHWGRLYNCLKRRTRFKDEAAPIPEKAPGIWETRTKEEAREAWEEEFGHLWGGEEHATKAEEETI